MEKLRDAIRQYLSLAASSRKIAAAKGRITKLVNESADELGAEKARELARTVLALVIAEDQPTSIDRVEQLKNRFDPKSFYLEGDRVFGWVDPQEQAQAVELPLYYNDDAHYYYVSFYRRQEQYPFWSIMGFEAAEDLPTRRRGEELEVSFDVKRSAFWLQYGYALPCQLPWHRGRFDRNDPDECLWVSRSIIPAGWWCAWKWWEGCQWWYYERHPEWFVDMDWWGTYEPTPSRYEPIDDPYALVLGGV